MRKIMVAITCSLVCSCKKTLKEMTIMCMNGTSSLCLLNSPLVLSSVLHDAGKYLDCNGRVSSASLQV